MKIISNLNSIKHLHLYLTIITLLSVMTLSCSSSAHETSPSRKPLIVAHRGGADLGMENSLSCIEKGIATGADMVEIDVHLTSDGQVVVCHDPTIDRTTNGEGKIEELTLSQIRLYRLVDKNGAPSDETIPTLQEVLQLIHGRCGLLLEIKKKKDQYVGIERKVVDLLEEYDMMSHTVIQSFNDPVLEEIHRLKPDIRIERLSFVPPRNLDKYPDVASFNTCSWFTRKAFVNRAHRHGKEVKIWTVNKLGRASRLPADGFITNNPELFKSR